MTLHHSTRHTAPVTSAGAPRQRTRDWLTGLGALLLLFVFVVGIPVVLHLVAPLGGAPTSWSGVISALTRPDNGRLFLATLALVAWIAWAAFALSVTVETAAVLRGIPTPAIPLLHAPQRAAASLVASAALLLSAPTPPAATPKPVLASAPAATAPATSTTPALQANTRPQPTPPTALPSPAVHHERTAPTRPTTAHTRAQHTVTVHRGDTLWSLAETHLGAGSRFREIAQLNYGRPQPDGRTLTDTHWIYPGWVLVLPTTLHTSTRTPTTSRPAPTHQGHERVYTVRKGDTLWAIAQQQLEDPLRYKEIFDLNKGRPQHDGKTLTDPTEILIGWTLHLPAQHHSGDATSTRAHSSAQPSPAAPTVRPGAPRETTSPTEAAGATPLTSATPNALIIPGHHRPDPTGDSRAATGVAATPAPKPPTSSASPLAVHTDHSRIDDAGVDFSRLAIGLTALAATGALTEVARRRRRQQSSRRPGQRVTMPEGQLAVAETQLRASNAPLTLDTLRTALAQIVTACRATRRPLPRIHAVLASATSIDLLVPDDTEPCAPFAAASPGRWTLDMSALDDSPPDALIGGYPALVSVGTVEDAVLLLNLEAAGTLAITGEQTAVDEAMRTIAVELGTSPLSAGVALTLPEHLADLADVADPDRVCATTTDAGARRAHARTTAVRELLDSLPAADVLQARTTATDNDAWQPEILLTDTDSSAAPWSGVCIIGTRMGDRGSRLHIGDDGTATLHPLGIGFRPSRLSDPDYKQLLALLGPPDPAPHDDDNDATGIAGDELRVDSATAALRSRRLEVLAALPHAVHSPSLDLTTRPPAVLDSGAETWSGIRLLGRPDIVGARGGDDNRRARQIELVAYLALHPGATAHEIDEALFPGRRVTHDMRNSLVTRTRTWLGADTDGALHLPLVSSSSGYRLADGFGSDWDDFLTLARHGLESDAVEPLQAALRLVRGRPFLGVDPAAYVWAEAVTQEMISSVVDVAYELAVRLLDDGEPSAAQDAAARGLLADPANESLHRIAITAALSRGDREDAHRLEARLRIQLEDIDPDASTPLLTT